LPPELAAAGLTDSEKNRVVAEGHSGALSILRIIEAITERLTAEDAAFVSST
jgi:hypothetical protein